MMTEKELGPDSLSGSPVSKRKEDAVRALVAFVAAMMWSLNLKSFVQAGDLFPGGFSGVTRLIQRVAEQYFELILPFAPINIFFNAIPAIIAFKYIGKKFTLFSCLVILLNSTITDMIPTINITEDVLLVSVFGGIVSGLASSLCLRARITGGGTDFISIALSERKNINAWNYIFLGNVALLIVAGVLLGWDRALYSIIYQFSATQVIKLLDPDGRRETLVIVTRPESVDRICDLIQDTHHTATLLQGTGHYNGAPCVMIYTVIESRQARWLLKAVKEYDPTVFINIMPTERVVGRFYRRPRD